MPLPPAATRAAVISNLQIAQHLHSAPQAHGTTCSLRLYVPNILLSFITELFGYLDRTGHAHFGARNGTSCLLQECQHATFIQHATLAFTGEWPLYRHLVETCRIVSEVSEADFVLAPAFVGTLIALGWTKPPGRGRWSLQWFKLLEESWVMQYGARTLIFASIDVPHLNFQVMKNQMLRPLTWVHQGDTTYTRSEKSIGRNGLHLAESVTVPHRTSQWLPFGFPPQPRPPKTLLLYGNINTDKKIHGEMRRMQLANDIASAVSALNVSEAVQLDWLSVKAAGCADDPKTATHKKRCRRGTDADLKTPKAAALASMKSRFCLCPSGDIPTSFTARLFFSVIHDCIPVVLDLWGYVGEDSGKLAFPFPLSIDWQRFVIVRSGMGRAHDVVRELVTMSDTEVGARLAYMRSIAAWLVYDGLGGDMSAEAALVKELESRVRARRRLVEPVVAVAAPAVPARVASHAPVPAGIQIPSAQPVRCSLNLSAPALADRAYFRLFGPSYRLHHSRGGDSRWKGVMQPALWRDGDLLIDVGGGFTQHARSLPHVMMSLCCPATQGTSGSTCVPFWSTHPLAYLCTRSSPCRPCRRASKQGSCDGAYPTERSCMGSGWAPTTAPRASSTCPRSPTRPPRTSVLLASSKRALPHSRRSATPLPSSLDSHHGAFRSCS